MRKISKRRIILKAAYELFEEYGYKKVSIDEIVDKAGIAKGTFYLYFKDKDEVYRTVFFGVIEPIDQRVHMAIECQGGDVRKMLFESFIGALLFISKNKIFREIFMENENYYSRSVNFDVLLEEMSEHIGLFFKKNDKFLRQDASVDHLVHTYIYAIKSFYAAMYGHKCFWDIAGNVGKMFIDGILSQHTWRVDSVAKVRRRVEKMMKKSFDN